MLANQQDVLEILASAHIWVKIYMNTYINTYIPSVHLVGDGLIKAFGLLHKLSILVLSPRIDPPVLLLEGSIAYKKRYKGVHTNHYIHVRE